MRYPTSHKALTQLLKASTDKMELLRHLFRSQSFRHRRFVATTALTPEAGLTYLAKDADHRVRIAVAENPRATAEAFAILARDSNNRVRLAVAENPQSTEEARAILANDLDFDVLNSLKRTEREEAERAERAEAKAKADKMHEEEINRQIEADAIADAKKEAAKKAKKAADVLSRRDTHHCEDKAHTDGFYYLRGRRLPVRNHTAAVAAHRATGIEYEELFAIADESKHSELRVLLLLANGVSKKHWDLFARLPLSAIEELAPRYKD